MSSNEEQVPMFSIVTNPPSEIVRTIDNEAGINNPVIPYKYI